jgi:hypothetical protein
MPKTVCSGDKILNPSTGRCVSKTGKIGRQLVQSKRQQTKKIEQPSVQSKQGTKRKPQTKGKKPNVELISSIIAFLTDLPDSRRIGIEATDAQLSKYSEERLIKIYNLVMSVVLHPQWYNHEEDIYQRAKVLSTDLIRVILKKRWNRFRK